MLAGARKRIGRSRLSSQARLLRGDIRSLPFRASTFPLVMAS